MGIEFGSWMSNLAFGLVGCMLLVLLIDGSSREPTLSRLMVPALAFRSVVFLFSAFVVLPYYAGMDAADAVVYHARGVEMLADFETGRLDTQPWALGSSPVIVFTAIIYRFTGPNIHGMFLLSSLMGLAAALWHAKAFLLWQGNGARYAALVLFLPSWAFWTSLYGKDSCVAMGLALAHYGYALCVKRGISRGAWRWVTGVMIVALIRPHVALAWLIATALASVFARNTTRSRSLIDRKSVV